MFHHRRGEIAEAAITLPVVMLAVLALINLSLAGFAAVNANNAANFGARMGSVAQRNPAVLAVASANQSLGVASVGDYNARVVAAGGGRGQLLAVQVDWEVPNLFGGLARFFGAETGDTLRGAATSYFRQEGW